MMAQKYMITETEKNTHHQNSQLLIKKKEKRVKDKQTNRNQLLSEYCKISLPLS